MVRPWMLARVGEVSGSRETPYGTIFVGWKADYDTFNLRIHIPANTRAVCEMPYTEGFNAGVPAMSALNGKMTVLCGNEVVSVNAEIRNGRMCCELGSGDYSLICQ